MEETKRSSPYPLRSRAQSTSDRSARLARQLRERSTVPKPKNPKTSYRTPTTTIQPRNIYKTSNTILSSPISPAEKDSNPETPFSPARGKNTDSPPEKSPSYEDLLRRLDESDRRFNNFVQQTNASLAAQKEQYEIKLNELNNTSANSIRAMNEILSSTKKEYDKKLMDINDSIRSVVTTYLESNLSSHLIPILKNSDFENQIWTLFTSEDNNTMYTRLSDMLINIWDKNEDILKSYFLMNFMIF